MNKELLHYNGIKPLIVVLLFITALQGVAILLQAKYLAEGVTSLFYLGIESTFVESLGFFTVAFVSRYLLVWLKDKLVYQYAEKTTSIMRKEMLTKLFTLGPRFAKKQGTGELVTLVMEGVSQVRDYLELFLPKVVAVLVLPIIIWIYVWSLDVKSSVVLAASLPILIMFMILLGLVAKAKADRQWKSYRVLSNHYVDSLRGLETLKFLGLSKSHEQSIAGVSKQYKKETMSTLRVAFLSSFALDFFTMLSVAIVAVFLGLALIEGEMLLGPALTILILAPEYFLSVRELGSDFHATLNGQEAAKSMKRILEEPLLIEEKEWELSNWSNEDELQFNHLNVSHHKNEGRILKDISLRIKGKKKIGIVGESGAGKSTLIDVIGGFLQSDCPAIAINGREVHHLKNRAWQRQILYLPQHPYIFFDSLANNIRFYQPNASMVEVKRAADQAGLTELIWDLNDGLEENIGESGRELSGGQAQRVALARAFLEDRPVLLLDEPTAHLDIETEMDIKERMLSLFNNKLVVLATHRLHWMKEMDEIIVLHDGRVVEQGNHQELMKKRGKYYELQQIQGGRTL